MKKSPWTLFDGWPRPTHWHSQICYRRLFKIWPSTVTPNDPKMTSDQKFLNIPKESLAKDFFTQVSSKSIESCRWQSVLSVFEQWHQMTPRWPLTQNSWTPLLLPHLMIIVSKYHENWSRHIRKEAFSNCERIDRYRDKYTDTHPPTCPGIRSEDTLYTRVYSAFVPAFKTRTNLCITHSKGGHFFFTHLWICLARTKRG